MLIFDCFPGETEARQFAAQCERMFESRADVFFSREESDAVTPFPFPLFPPVVQVSRHGTPATENAIIFSVATFRGRFAGT